MFDQSVLDAAWELTKPKGISAGAVAERYRHAMVAVASNPQAPYYFIFNVPKVGRGNRRIHAANEPLRFIQGILAAWISRNFELGHDYCYSGAGVLPAVRRHQCSNSALVFDLKDAFESVTKEKLEQALALRLRGVEKRVLAFVVGLLTYQGQLRQGCVSSPQAYDLATESLHKHLQLLVKQFGLLAFTQYADNFCFSSPNGIRFDELEEQARRLVRGNGFRLSWMERFERKPIIYLGTQIEKGRLSLAPMKHDEFYCRLLEATENLHPRDYEREVGGIFVWAKHVCGEKDFPGDLLELLTRYYQRLGRLPEALVNLKARSLQMEMIF